MFKLCTSKVASGGGRDIVELERAVARQYSIETVKE